jgi:putative membrane protein
MLRILFLTVAGGILGTFTGLVPGIHVNTIVVIILSLLPLLLEHLSPHEVISLIVAMSIVHTFVDYIPSILIGAPEEESVLSVLPGHRLLMQGRGYEAIFLTALGGLGAMILGCAFLPLAVVALPSLYSYTRAVLPYLLVGVLAYMVYIEKTPKKRIFSILVILYSGALGMLVLNSAILPPKYALFPPLTGLFGISTLLISLRAKPKIPPQAIGYTKGLYLRGIGIGALAGILAGLLPSIGSSQSALMVQNAFKKREEKEFLVALGGVNTSNAIYALLALYLISNPRSGASIAVEHILKDFIFLDFLFVVAIILLVAPFALATTLALLKIFIRRVQDIDYGRFSKYVLTFLGALIFAFTGLKGLIIAATAAAIGFTTPIAGIKRSHCMAVLMVPTIFYFLF